MQLEAQISGYDRVNKHLTALTENMESMKTMAEVGKAVEEYNKKMWGKGVEDVEATTERWPGGKPLDNPAAAEAEGRPQLKDTFRVKEVTPISVTYGTDDFRARILQSGSGKMTKKRVIKLPRKAIKEILRAAIMRGV